MSSKKNKGSGAGAPPLVKGHAAGPWRADADGYVFDADGEIVCSASGLNEAANARLIAAAPDLLKALQTLMGSAAHMSPFGSVASVKNVRLAGKYMEAFDAATAAIKRVEA